MMKFGFSADDWKQVESPRRYIFEAFHLDITINAGVVSVWEKGSDSDSMKEADVDLSFKGKHIIEIESSYKFDGEVRVSF